MKALVTSLLLAVAGLVAGSAALAGGASAPAAGGGRMAACRADAERLCPGVKPGNGGIRACFKEHHQELSAECKKELEGARRAHNG